MADLMAIGVDPNLWFSNFSSFPWDVPATYQQHQIPHQPPQNSSNNQQSQQHRYVCSSCNKSYAQYTSLYNHKKFECGKPATLKCPYCHHMTKLKGNLKAHIMNKHSAEVMAQAEKAQAEKTLREKNQQNIAAGASVSIEGNLTTNEIPCNLDPIQPVSTSGNNNITLENNQFDNQLLDCKDVDLIDTALDFP